MGVGAVQCTMYTPPYCGFCPLLKKSKVNPYLKILDFSQLFVVDASIIFLSGFFFTNSPVGQCLKQYRHLLIQDTDVAIIAIMDVPNIPDLPDRRSTGY